LKVDPKALNPHFARFISEAREDRLAVFTAVAESKKASSVAIEKDFFVCRVLDALFHGLEAPPQLFFKGGTSLSKGFGLINRFSEDIDIVISAPDLGFAQDKDPANPKITSSMRKKVLSTSNPDSLPQALQSHTTNEMLPALAQLLPDCKIEQVDTPDKYGAALAVKYETVLGKDKNADDYISRSVLIETGARSAREPAIARDITPYIQDQLDETEWNLAAPGITLIKPERTFWDKVYILDGMWRAHEAGKLEVGGADRKSRHHYDVAMMWNTDIGKSAIADRDLAERVRVALQAPEEAKPNALRLVPPDDVISALRQDYERGTSLMVFGDPPAFDTLLGELRALEIILKGH
jgi:hypothetical protein